ncbi:MAG: isoprenylcysteine carboxylmethyltransferase family protein [Clostridiaceae bacterium]|nr:isoprenylcysteine carboxylmethyltransferase family protein [Clostridiaceae bacterium]
MKHSSETKQGAIKYLFMLLWQRIIGVAIFILSAGTIANLQGIVYFSLYLVISVIACILMYRDHQDTLSERGKRHENTKSWDKVLMPVYVLLAFYVIYLIAGLGIRYQWEQLSINWFYAGIILYLISSVLTIWPVFENKHFESTSRIQNDREQAVISTGPYRIVRHPGYLGIVIWAIATSFMFGTLAVGITAAIIIAVIVIRTYLEDTMLKKELKGYQVYAKKVKYRLIPYIW